MLVRRATKLRSFLATLCVALTFVLALQAPVAALEQAQHSLSINHAAGTFVAQLSYDHEHHVVDQDHAQKFEAEADRNAEAPFHHHHGDLPQFLPLARADGTSALSMQSLAFRGARDAPPPSGMIFGLDRPPRNTLEVFA